MGLFYENKMVWRKKDTPDNWQDVDPILPYGAMGYEIGTNRFKIGDGVKRWTELGYTIEHESTPYVSFIPYLYEYNGEVDYLSQTGGFYRDGDLIIVHFDIVARVPHADKKAILAIGLGSCPQFNIMERDMSRGHIYLYGAGPINTVSCRTVYQTNVVRFKTKASSMSIGNAMEFYSDLMIMDVIDANQQLNISGAMAYFPEKTDNMIEGDIELGNAFLYKAAEKGKSYARGYRVRDSVFVEFYVEIDIRNMTSIQSDTRNISLKLSSNFPSPNANKQNSYIGNIHTLGFQQVSSYVGFNTGTTKDAREFEIYVKKFSNNESISPVKYKDIYNGQSKIIISGDFLYYL